MSGVIGAYLDDDNNCVCPKCGSGATGATGASGGGDGGGAIGSCIAQGYVLLYSRTEGGESSAPCPGRADEGICVKHEQLTTYYYGSVVDGQELALCEERCVWITYPDGSSYTNCSGGLD